MRNLSKLKQGKKIVEKNNQIKRIDESHYQVNSQSRNKQHDVISLEYGWSCSCEDHYFKKIDSAIITGMQIHHNYIRPHQGLDGDTPVDRSGIII